MIKQVFFAVFPSSSEFPLVDEKGIDLEPNTLTQVGIQETEIVRADHPYGWDNCTLDWEDENYPKTAVYAPTLIYSIAVRSGSPLGRVNCQKNFANGSKLDIWV